jgi:hypothetical protein
VKLEDRFNCKRDDRIGRTLFATRCMQNEEWVQCAEPATAKKGRVCLNIIVESSTYLGCGIS